MKIFLADGAMTSSGSQWLLIVAVGLLAGVVAALLHLGILYYRARRLARGGFWGAMLGFPIGLLAPAAVLLMTARLGAACLWLAAVAFLVARWLLLRGAARRIRRSDTGSLGHTASARGGGG